MSPVVHTITVKPRQSQERYPMSDTVDTTETNDTELTPTDRRALLRKIAIGGAGAAAGAVMLNNGRASAADGANLVLGTAAANEADTPTYLTYNDASAALTDASVLSVGEDRPSAADGNNVYPAAVGGYGKGDVPSGLHGSTINPAGFGVVAANLAPNPDASTAPTTKGLAIASTGAHVLFLAGAKTGPANGTHVAGELYVDKDGTLWFTVPVPAPAPAGTVRFVKLAGTPTAGSYHAIDPQRVYDSRQTGYTVKGALAPNTNRVVSVADGRNANGTTVTLKDAVPTGATAVQLNLTAANMTGPNFLSVTAGDKTSTTTSLLNWGPGDIQIANSITVPIDAKREIRVYCGDQTGSTDFIVDIFGYYL
jgi:hypothetical protein